MNPPYKPSGYNAVSPYFVVNGAQKLISLFKQVFDATELRRYNRPDGSVMHAELKIDDSVLMISDASEQFPPLQQLVHIYVQDVDLIFQKAIDAGCEAIDPPKEREGDPDRRGSFKDPANNFWSIATQMKEES
uniref:VOC family protein n=1 Tax=Roseihalotalea indica TaxID=2867963 RepID=A0AA49PZR7_9BACT|nr:VOC family protein [Tunicatimonas sp. TK19036]